MSSKILGKKDLKKLRVKFRKKFNLQPNWKKTAHCLWEGEYLNDDGHQVAFVAYKILNDDLVEVIEMYLNPGMHGWGKVLYYDLMHRVHPRCIISSRTTVSNVAYKVWKGIQKASKDEPGIEVDCIGEDNYHYVDNNLRNKPFKLNLIARFTYKN